MRATGHLAKISRAKYGFREDKRVDGLNVLFDKIRPLISKSPQLKSDACPLYRRIVEKHFPSANYLEYKGGRGAEAM